MLDLDGEGGKAAFDRLLEAVHAQLCAIGYHPERWYLGEALNTIEVLGETGWR